jgi:DNA (cytosine-5)-methyltransferase 1
MSYGFFAHPSFRIVGAVDAQRGKPSSGHGKLECNKTYENNIHVPPLHADIGVLSEAELRAYLKSTSGTDQVDVLISCAPCTGFSRTIRKNLVQDDRRNSLVSRSADFVEMFRPSVFVMENVGELLNGRFSYHYENLRDWLENLGYSVSAEVHSLDEFGLPQTRKRALVIAAKKPLAVRTLTDLWNGYRVKTEAVTVRRAIGDLPPVDAGTRHPDDPMHTSPNFSEQGLRRLHLIPRDGGSWPDLLRSKEGESLLIPSMLKYVEQGRVGPHPDVYGRLAWDRPAVTIKRECAHTGNGRYAHPEQDRLCTVRELGLLQGFPRNYEFMADSLSNMYRHIGDAVPPLISFQLAGVCHWILSGKRPEMSELVLPETQLKAEDIEENSSTTQLPLLELA